MSCQLNRCLKVGRGIAEVGAEPEPSLGPFQRQRRGAVVSRPTSGARLAAPCDGDRPGGSVAAPPKAGRRANPVLNVLLELVFSEQLLLHLDEPSHIRVTLRHCFRNLGYSRFGDGARRVRNKARVTAPSAGLVAQSNYLHVIVFIVRPRINAKSAVALGFPSGIPLTPVFLYCGTLFLVAIRPIARGPAL